MKEDLRLQERILLKANYSIAGMYITSGDYYAITHQSMFLDMSKFFFENKGPINILKESEAQNLSNETCVNCVVELNKESRKEMDYFGKEIKE